MTETPDNTPVDAPAIDQLWPVLDEMAERAEELVGLIREQQGAVRTMDPEAIRDTTARQATVAARLRELEARRATLAGPAPLSQLASSMPDPGRQRAAAIAGRIARASAALAREGAIMRACAGAMLGHIEGLMRAVARELSHTGAYGPQGTVAAGQQVVSGMDITR